MNTEPTHQGDKITATSASPPSLAMSARPQSSARSKKRSLTGVLADPRVRLGAGTAVMLATAIAARRNHVSPCEATAFRAVNGLPDSLYPPAWLVTRPFRAALWASVVMLTGVPR